MHKIAPHLWFDTQSRESAELYTSVFDGSEIVSATTLRDTPSGDAEVVSFVLAGQPFMAISAGPLFRFTPSVSFRIDCATPEEVDALWNRLIEEGEVLMPLDAYPFSARYGWLKDRYGLSWQVNQTWTSEITQKIVPTLMFAGDVCGRTEEAITLYTSVFDGSETGYVMRYGPREEPDAEGTIKFAAFTLGGMHFAAMDSAGPHQFSFNEAISLMAFCDTQEQIDHCWERLSAVPEAEQCGWLKDRYGVSWQIVPTALHRMMEDADEAARARVTRAVLGMRKLDLSRLEDAYAGR